MEVDTVSTRITLDIDSCHVSLSGVWMLDLRHSCILPWVLTSVEEEDVVSPDVETTIVEISPISSCLDFNPKDSFTVIGPKI